jgi:hypothetical protein
MARPLRIAYPGAVYHVTARGNARQVIVREEKKGRRKGSSRSLTELPCPGSLASCRVPSASNSPVPRTM